MAHPDRLNDTPSRIVAIDYGTRRVGLALADPLHRFAQPYGTFNQDEAVQRLKDMHEREGLGTIVVGWPLLDSGAEGAAAGRVQQYINRLRKVLPGVCFEKWDEGYTSEEAKDRLAQSGRRVTRERIDTAAAGIILQEYLDCHAHKSSE